MEKEFKSKLKGSVPEWDKMKNWDAIEAQLPKPKKERRWLFFFLPFMSIILLFLVVEWQLSHSDSGNQNDPRPTEGFDVQVKSDTSFENSGQANANDNTKPTDFNNNDDKPKILSQNNYTPRNNTNTKVSKRSMVENPKTKLKNNTSDAVTDNNSSTQLFSSDLSAIIIGTKDNIAQQDIPKVEEIKDLEATSPLVLKLFYPTTSDSLINLDENINLIAPLKRKKATITLQAYANISMPFRQFSANTVELQPYLNSRENRESMAQSIETGILMNAYLSPQISLSSGIGIQQITERFDWKNVTTEIVPVLSDTALYYLDQSNSRNYLADTVNAIVTETRKVKNFNTHTFYNIPLLVGYEKNIGQFSFRTSTGPVLQFYRGFEGRIFDESENFISGDDLRAQGEYKNKVGLSLDAGIDISRPVGKFGRIHAGFQYRHGLFSVTDFSTGYKQTYSSIGINLGWSFKLFR